MYYQTLSFFESIFKHFSRANEERITNKDLEVNNSHRDMHEQGEGLFGRHCSPGQYELEEGFKSGIEGVPSLGREDPPPQIPEGGNGNPLQDSCLENPMDGGARWSTMHGSQRVKHN